MNNLSDLLQQDLDKNMRIYEITKYFRGGREIYYALLPKTKKVAKGMWTLQLDRWGENTNGGHEAGWNIYAKIVKKIPEKARRLYFDESYIENKSPVLRKEEEGHCAQCGCMTSHWDAKWQWFICKDHDSMEVARSIAQHVMHPNA